MFLIYTLIWNGKFEVCENNWCKEHAGYNTGIIGSINRNITELHITHPPLQLYCIIHQHALCAKVINLKNDNGYCNINCWLYLQGRYESSTNFRDFFFRTWRYVLFWNVLEKSNFFFETKLKYFWQRISNSIPQ